MRALFINISGICFFLYNKSMLTEFDVTSRLVIAAILGGFIGLEREQLGKVAGLRTHALTAMGSALLALISLYLFETLPSVGGVAGFDYHLIANIIVGIGFIGGGAILRNGDSRIIGTTTAATLWVVAAIGIAVGIGFMFAALITTIISLILLTLVWRFEKRFLGKK